MTNHSKNSGFTLIELTITLGIFVFVIFLILSIFTNSLKAERNVANQTAILDNLSLVIEQMAREIRTGTNFPSSPETSSFAFKNYLNQNVVYSKPADGDYVTKNTNGVVTRLTADDIQVTNLKFYITQPDFYPPRVTIQFQVKSSLFQGVLTFQTTVSERLFYYKAS
ncbi:MAG: hypothetical protein M1586_02070 [Patescibacteria group bacterium]|nr:hypothetical protein [Patescibacteria group bacterium]MCL5262067.1 hypothetical protein [Patescibacteria group bacterium]